MADVPVNRGRPPFQPSAEQRSVVLALRKHGITTRTIAAEIGIDRATLNIHFREELSRGNQRLEARIGLTLAQAALRDWHAALAWLQRFGGSQWRIPKDAERAGDAPTAPTFIDPDTMTDDEIRRRIIELERKITIEGEMMDKKVPFLPTMHGKMH
jgi:hypothetical protein